MKYRSFYVVVLLAVGLLESCGKSHSHGHEAEEVHSEKISLSSYGQHYEVYCESDPLIVGQQSELLVHLTRLSDFKPLAKGKVSLAFRVDGKGQTLHADSLLRPGVCSFVLTPQKVGKGEMHIKINSGEVVQEQIAIPVQIYSDQTSAHESLKSQQLHNANTVAFSKEMSWKSDFSTVVCRLTPFGPALWVMAQVQAAQGEERDVVAQTAGVVRMGSNPPVEGMEVRVGETLLVVDGSTTAEGNLSVRFHEAETAWKRAKSELDRKEPLAKEHIVSQSDLQNARADYETAKAEYESLKRLFGRGTQTVTSPVRGYVAQVNVKNGQYVEAGQSLLSVTDTRWLTLRALVAPQSWRLLPHIKDAYIRISDSDTLTSLSALDGCLLSYGRQISVQEPHIPVLFQVRYNTHMLPGSWVEMFVQTETGREVLTVPVESLIEEMGLHFVYVQLTPELFEKREVTIGGTDGKRTEIQSGLKAGDRVVAKGAVLVKLTQASGGVDPHAGHSH